MDQPMGRTISEHHHHLVFRSASAQPFALLSAMPETVEQYEAYLAAKYSRPRDEDIPPRASSSSHGITAEHFSTPIWDEASQAFYARPSAEPPLSVAPSTIAPMPSPGPATKVVPSHP